jgi:hypothetical protein
MPSVRADPVRASCARISSACRSSSRMVSTVRVVPSSSTTIGRSSSVAPARSCATL